MKRNRKKNFKGVNVNNRFDLRFIMGVHAGPNSRPPPKKKSLFNAGIIRYVSIFSIGQLRGQVFLAPSFLLSSLSALVRKNARQPFSAATCLDEQPASKDYFPNDFPPLPRLSRASRSFQAATAAVLSDGAGSLPVSFSVSQPGRPERTTEKEKEEKPVSQTVSQSEDRERELKIGEGKT